MATRAQDAASLERILATAAVTCSTPELLDHLLFPFMKCLGDLWREGRLRVAQEHMASGIVRTFLGGLLRFTDSSDNFPKIIMATPAGQLHEIGALMAAVTAASEGWNPTYLGPNLPAEELAGAAKGICARAIALSIIYPPDDVRLALELKSLRNYVPDDVSLLVGGRSAGNYRLVLDSIRASLIPDLPSLRNELGRLRAASIGIRA
jgi:MerR family transcriptional regulator, light-induced transcriptional regulator